MNQHVRKVGSDEIASWLFGKNIVRDTPPAATPPAATEQSETPAPFLPPAPPAEFNPLNFDNAADFIMFFNEEFDLYPWQVEELMRLSGYVAPGRSTERLKPSADNPMLYNLVATNGSGKDAVILCGFILWFLLCKVRSMVIATSFSEQQIEGQTFKHCKFYAERINEKLGKDVFSVKYLNITCTETGSECRMFVTNSAGRAEGFHANAGREFAVIINEAKSIPDELFAGFIRYTRWNYWIEVSSAGDRKGHFFRRVSTPEAIHYPNALKLSEHYVRYIKVKDCPGILEGDVRIKEIIRDFGRDSQIYKSVVESAFSSEDSKDILIQLAATEYQDPEPNDYGMSPVAGVDLSLGGDETVVSIWHGNRRVAQHAFRERYEPNLHAKLIDIFNRYGLAGENIAMDAGGLGRPIIHRIIEAGWNVHAFNFGGAAQNKRYCLNRGAELWQRLKRLVEEKLIVLPRDDYKFMEQLTSRRFEYSNGKIKLESKADVLSRGEPSPDRVDAAVMAWSLIDFNVFYDTVSEAHKPPPVKRQLTFEEADALMEARRYSPDERFRGEPNVGNNKGRIGGTLCRLLGVKLR